MRSSSDSLRSFSAPSCHRPNATACVRAFPRPTRGLRRTACGRAAGDQWSLCALDDVQRHPVGPDPPWRPARRGETKRQAGRTNGIAAGHADRDPIRMAGRAPANGFRCLARERRTGQSRVPAWRPQAPDTARMARGSIRSTTSPVGPGPHRFLLPPPESCAAGWRRTDSPTSKT
jgi:hypothetical protein